MTEEIVIDGVNVAGCRRRIGKNSYCRYFKRPCAENNFDCIWKQYERLKQKNKDLKKQIESDKGLITVGGKQQYEYLQRIDELEQENKALKDNNNYLQAIIDDGRAENKRFREENKELLEARNHFMGVNLKYFNALEEIRKYAEERCRQKVLDKINEVLE